MRLGGSASSPRDFRKTPSLHCELVPSLEMGRVLHPNMKRHHAQRLQIEDTGTDALESRSLIQAPDPFSRRREALTMLVEDCAAEGIVRV